MEKFDFSKAAQAPATTNGPSKMRPSVHENVVINSIQAIQPEGKTAEGKEKSPYVEIHFVDAVNGSEHREKFYMSNSAMPYTLSRLRDLVLATGQNVPDEASIETIQGLLTGKNIALRLYGEEVRLNDGKVVIVSKVSSQPFCAAAGKGSTLKWDETRAIKRLPESPIAPSAEATDQLPF